MIGPFQLVILIEIYIWLSNGVTQVLFRFADGEIWRDIMRLHNCKSTRLTRPEIATETPVFLSN